MPYFLEKCLAASKSGVLALLAGLFLAGSSLLLAWSLLLMPSHLLSTSYPVYSHVQGQLVTVYFTPGNCVARGQLLAKVQRPNGSPYYISAPVAGRITATHLSMGKSLAAHSQLARVEVLSQLSKR